MRVDRTLFLLLAMLLILAGSVPGATVQTMPHGDDFDLDCSLCHVVEGWSELKAPLEFDHNSTTFPLEGRHEQVDCQFCHESLEFRQASSQCFDCHVDVHSGQFTHDCSQCHSPEGWFDEAHFREMHQQTRFALTGAHDGLACTACHADGNYAEASLNCAGCHLDDYYHANNPDHAGAGFSTTCDECHGLVSVDWAGSIVDFDHTPDFPLVRGHRVFDCQACHAPGSNYAETSSECYSCHADDYNRTDDPNHAQAGFPTDCSICHTIDDWDDADDFNHSTTGFDLTGEHREVNCNECHTAGYAGTPTACNGCHQDDYDGATNPPHNPASFASDCSICHTTDGWSPAPGFDHDADTMYPLVGGHREAECSQCHLNNVYVGLPDACFDCHLEDYNDTDDPDHTAEGYPTDCEVCHTPVDWEEAEFDHQATEFPLTGAHLETDCADCHVDGYVNTPTDCYACHQVDYEDATEPIHNPDSFDFDCLLCHDTQTWEQSSFDHDQDTDFLVEGAHTELDCADCHIDGQYVNTPVTCFGCHEDDYNNTDDPDHAANNYPTDCTECHNQIDWEDVDDDDFPHDVQTGFPLIGGHAGLTCVDCHADGYANTDPACISCHQDDFDQAVPPHEAESFGNDCEVCHTIEGWTPSTFDHDTQTQFVINGSHTELNCADCHIDGQYASTPETCFGCHEEDYNDADDPDHLAGNYPTDCTICHNTSDWDDADFDHNTTDFPLTGAHTTLDCNLCHADGYTGTPTECFACHEDDYNNADDPDHLANNYPHDCTICHNTTDWDDADFDHNNTDFPLTGAHTTLDCNLCHSEGYTGTPTECFACHEDDYNNADDPDHLANNYPHDCTICHNTSDWDDADFDHNNTGFPLVGAHTTLDCNLCHSEGYTGTPTECFACHEGNYNGVSDPNHVTNSYPQVCTTCHTQASWTPLDSFDHDQWTDFPLEGEHTGVNCSMCHTNGYEGTPSTCFACHEGSFNNADPPHDPGSFGTDCTICHSVNGWTPSTFDHNQQTDYDLTGQHLTLDCTLCHVGGQYTGTPDECFFCHEDDYNQTNDPNHQQVMFPTTCDLCHNTFDWEDAQFNHIVWFPIYSGEHQGEWDSCSECHPNPNDYTDFTCLTCHLQGAMDNEHDDVPGYQYNSLACYNCHPDGDEGPNLFPDQIEPDEERKGAR